jgi:nicotinamidase-related amidase
MLKVHLLVIDPQIDFCDPSGSLFVPGADSDMKRLATMINRLGKKLEDIHVTMDTHHQYDIAHPMFWADSAGKHPAPFTLITMDDINAGKWRTTVPSHMQRARDYVEALNRNNRYLLCIWPPHCLIGSKGHGIQGDVYEALVAWEAANIGFVDYVTKGSNFWTEHYSAVQADVPDAQDASTQLNTQLITILQEADIIAIAGEALSHCVANTVQDIANNFGEDNIKKMVLLEDCSSNVTGFDGLGNDFVKAMKSRGMQISKSTDFLV